MRKLCFPVVAFAGLRWLKDGSFRERIKLIGKTEQGRPHVQALGITVTVHSIVIAIHRNREGGLRM